MPRQDFVDERVSKKQRKLDKERAEAEEKKLREAEEQVQIALNKNRRDVANILTPKEEQEVETDS